MKFPEIKVKCCAAAALIIMALCLTGSVSASSGGGHDKQAPKGWVATDTYRVMNFAVLVIGLFILLRKPASRMLASRIDGIKTQLEDLEAKKRAAEKKLAEYDERLARLDEEADEIIAEYVRQGNDARARILEEAQSAADRLEAQARRNIEHEFNQAKLHLQEEIMEKALTKAEEIIKDKITSQDQEKLIDEYLEKVVV